MSLSHVLDSGITVKLLVKWVQRNCASSLSSRTLGTKHISSDSNCIYSVQETLAMFF
jgi:hypoxanthine-guanine phosphoribosyltransferase